MSQLNVTKANIHDGLQLAPNLWNILEEVSGFFDSHIKHFSNILALICYFEGFRVIPFAMANFARHVNIR